MGKLTIHMSIITHDSMENFLCPVALSLIIPNRNVALETLWYNYAMLYLITISLVMLLRYHLPTT